MKAAEARRQSLSNAHALAVERAKERRHRRIANVSSARRNHEKFFKDYLEELESYIKTAIESGSRKVTHTLSRDHHDLTYHDGSYRGRHFVEGSLYGAENFFKRAKYKKEIKRIVEKLRRDGFTVVVEGRQIEHDESVAYLNSGGECGSETPYYTDDTVLEVSW